MIKLPHKTFDVGKLRKLNIENESGLKTATIPMRYKGIIYRGSYMRQRLDCITDRIAAGVNVQYELVDIIYSHRAARHIIIRGLDKCANF